MKHVKKMMIAALCLPVIILSGCKNIPSYSADYGKARTTIPGVMLNDTKALEIGRNFTQTFNMLGTPEFVNKASQLYEDKLFINDTLSQFSSKNNLVEHFKGMNNRVNNVTVELLNASYNQDSAYIHWYMTYDFKIFGTTKTMASYGISEIKINDNNKIIFQQDFWDPANGLYRSLPYVGGTYSWMLPFKKSQ